MNMRHRFASGLLTCLCAAAALLFSGSRAQADMRLSIKNETSYELLGLSAIFQNAEKADPETAALNTLPGESQDIQLSGSAPLQSLTLEMGLTRFTFADAAAIRDGEALILSVKNDTPTLASKHWGPKALHGASTDLQPDENAPALPFQDLLSAASMDEIRKAAENASCKYYESSNGLLLPVALGADLWIGLVEPEASAGKNTEEEQGAAPARITLRLDYGSGQLEGGLLDYVYSAGFRPFSLRKSDGSVKRFIAQTTPEAPRDADDDRMEFLTLITGAKPDEKKPGTLTGLIVHETTYDELAAKPDTPPEKLTPAPCFTVRLTNSFMLEFIYEADCRARIDSETRTAPARL